jgi:hypothetical protein
VRIALSLTAFTFLYGLPEEILDLAINAAQLILRPGFEFSPEFRVNAK